MVRVELTGPQDVNGLMASAYGDASGRRQVLVFVNCAPTPKEIQLRFKSGKDGGATYTPYVTSAEKNLGAAEKIVGSKKFTVPARCVMTLVSENIAGRGAPPLLELKNEPSINN